MKRSFKSSLVLIMISLALLVSALGVTPALADDETPPPPATEETPQPPAEEPVVVEEPAPVVEVLEQLPADTSLVVVDASGEALPLATEAAAEVVAEADPKWCPEGALPDNAACSSNFATIAALLTSMQANVGGFYSQNGVIYFERASVTTFTDPFILDDSAGSLGTSYDTLKTFNITLRGGWNGGTTKTFSGSSAFKDTDAYVQVGTDANPWVGDVTIKNIQIGSNNNTAPNIPVGVNTNHSLSVYTSSGDITVDNVDVQRQEGGYNTGYLQSQTGNITVQNGSTFDGNDVGQLNKGFEAKTDSGSISITNTTFRDASGGNAMDYNGATLSATVVNLTRVTANSSDGSGVYVTGTGLTLVNVYGGTFNSNGRGTYGDGSGLFVNGTGPTIVNLDGVLISGVMTGATFNNNGRYGVEVTNGILNELFAPASCTGNGLDCYNVTPNATPSITVNSVTIEANMAGGWKLAFNAIGSASDAEDGTPSVACTPVAGTFLAVGTTTLVSCTAKDSGGLTATASGNITVVDTTAPSLSLPSDLTVVAASPAGSVVSFATSADDVVSGPLAVSCAPASGSTFPLGATTVNCSAQDGANNMALGSFQVTVKDTGAPVLTLPADISLVVHQPGDAVVTFSASATDFIEGSLPVTCTPVSGTIFPDGTTPVKCTATDSAGNTSTGSFSVTVDLDREGAASLYRLVEQQQDQLPGKLEQGQAFGSAWKLEYVNRGPKGDLLLSFLIPAGMKDANLAVRFWSGSQWVTLSGGSVAGDYFVIKVARPGTYILVGL